MMHARPFYKLIGREDHSTLEQITCAMVTSAIFEWGRATCVQINNVQENILDGGFEQGELPCIVFLFPEADRTNFISGRMVVGDIVLFGETEDEGWCPRDLSRVEIVLDSHNLSLGLCGEDFTFRYVFPTPGFFNEFLVSLKENVMKN